MHSAGRECVQPSDGSVEVVTVFFRPSPIFAAVENVLKREGALAESMTSGIFRKWHTEAWKRRFQTPLLHGKPLESALTDPNDLTETLMSADRVFVRAQPMREILSYVSWLEVFAKERLEQFPPSHQIIFSRTPHFPYELVFYRVALRLGHEIFFLHDIMESKIFALTTGHDVTQPKWLAGKIRCLNQPSISDLLGSKRWQAVKAYNYRQSVGSALVSVAGTIIWMLSPSGTFGARSRHRLNYKNQIIFGRFVLFFRLVESIIERHQIRNFLTKTEAAAPQHSPYVLVALHYQPERTTDPEGGDFSHQVRFVQRVRDLLDESGRANWKILVREHPAQLRNRIPGLGEANFRSLDFYNGLLGVRDTSLAFSGVDEMPALIRNSSLVATITGDAALEALAIGVPALTGWRRWYSECDGVEDTESAALPGKLDALLSMSQTRVLSSVKDFFLTQDLLFGGDCVPPDPAIIDLNVAERVALGIIDRLRTNPPHKQ